MQSDLEILQSMECKNPPMSEEDQGINLLGLRIRESNRNEDKGVIEREAEGIRDEKETIYPTFIH